MICNSVTCDHCNGAGWMKKKTAKVDEWPINCAMCKGSGRISFYAIAKVSGSDPRTVRDVFDGVAGSRGSIRVLLGVMSLMRGSERQPGFGFGEQAQA